MRGASKVVLSALQEQIARLDDGARLPTVRALMRDFGVSQATVQDVLARLRDEGRLVSQVGRGTYVVRGGATCTPVAPPALDSVLILSNAALNERCVMVQNHLVGALSRSGSKVVQMSYHNTGHLLHILSSLPDFDAVILQSLYESIPIRLLDLLQGKTRALVVDGHTISGVDIDRVGTDWEEALDLALDRLAGLGHRSVALVALESMAQPVLSVRRAFERLGRRPGARWRDIRLVTLKGVVHPSQRAGPALNEALAPLIGTNGRFPFTAMLTLGITDSLGLKHCLDDLGIACPRDLSLVILGHHDVPSEHLGALTIAGSSAVEGGERLVEVIRRRLATPEIAPQIVYLGCRETVRRSTGAPAG